MGWSLILPSLKAAHHLLRFSEFHPSILQLSTLQLLTLGYVRSRSQPTPHFRLHLATDRELSQPRASLHCEGCSCCQHSLWRSLGWSFWSSWCLKPQIWHYQLKFRRASRLSRSSCSQALWRVLDWIRSHLGLWSNSYKWVSDPPREQMGQFSLWTSEWLRARVGPESFPLTLDSFWIVTDVLFLPGKPEWWPSSW